MKQTAVVILNWNGKALLERFLPFLVQYTNPALADIVVADNGSTDDSLEFLTKHYPKIQTILLDVNYGFADGYNKALKSIDSEYVVLLNSDVEVGENWLQPAINYLDEHPDVVALQPKVLSYRDKSVFEYAGAAGGFIDMYGYPFCRGRIFGTLEKDEGQYDEPIDILWASGACLFIRTAEFKSIGGFDEYFFAHQEEIDLCWRLRIQGKRIVCFPQSVVYHLGAATLKREDPQKTYLNYRNNLLMLFKNLPEPHFQKVMNVRFFLDYLSALLFLLKGSPANAFAIGKARNDFKRKQVRYRWIREGNMGKSMQELPPEVYGKSLLWKYYIAWKKTYNRLRIPNRNF
jgi:GT2 family glycosyltransferase